MNNARRPILSRLSTLATLTLAGLATVSGPHAYAGIDVLGTAIAEDSNATPPTEEPVTSSTGDQSFSDTTQILLNGPTSSLSISGGSTLTVGGIATALGTSTIISTGPTDGNFLVQSVNPAPSVFVSGTDSKVVLTGYSTTDASGAVLVDTPRLMVGNAGNVVVQAGGEIDAAGAASTGSQGAMIIGATIGSDALLQIEGVGSVVRAPSTLIVADDGFPLFTSTSTLASNLSIVDGGLLDAATVILGNGIDEQSLLDAIAQQQFFGLTRVVARVATADATLQATRLEVGARNYSLADLTIASGGNVNIGSGGLVVGGGTGRELATGNVIIENGGSLSSSGAIDIAPPVPNAILTPELTSSGSIDVQAGGTLSTTGALRIFNGGELFGTPAGTTITPRPNDGVITADSLELFRGGIIDDAHLEFSGIRQFVLHEGAFFSTDGDPDLAAVLVGLTGGTGSVGTVILNGGSAQVGANLGVGVTQGNVGSISLTGTLETFSALSVYGSMQVGTQGGQGEVTLGGNAFLALSPSLTTNNLTGPTLEIGSGGVVNVGGVDSAVFGAEEINVSGGTLNVSGTGGAFSTHLNASAGGTVNAGGIQIGADVGVFGKGVAGFASTSELTQVTPASLIIRGTGTSVNLNADGFVLDAETQEPLGPLARLVISNDGQISVLEGGQLNANAPSPISGGANTIIGDLLGSSARVLVDVAGSALRTADKLIIGNDGFDPLLFPAGPQPTLDIRNGGTVVSEQAIVSAGVDNPDVTDPAAKTVGFALVDGAGSSWSTQSLDIAAAERGTGQVTVTNGATLNIGAGGLRVGNGGIETDGTSGVLILDQAARVSITTDRSLIAPIRIGFDYDSSIPPPFDANGQVTPNGVVALSNGSSFTVDALDADGRVLVGYEGFGTLNIASGSQFIVNGTGPEVTETLNAGLIAGVFDSGNPLAHGTVLVNGTGSLLKITHEGSTARMIIGTGPSDPAYNGTGSATGELLITDGAKVRVEGIGVDSRVWVGEGSNAMGTLVVSGAGSTLELAGRNSVLFVGLDNPAANSSIPGQPAGRVRIDNGALLNIESARFDSPFGASALVVGQNGSGRLEVANATANINGDLVVLGDTANAVQIENGGVVNVTGTTAIFGGSVRGLAAATPVAQVSAVNTLSSAKIELHGSGVLNDIDLDLRDVQTFSILDGASFRTAKTYDIGGNQIGALNLIDGDLTTEADFHIGTDSASSGTVTVSANSELFVSGVLRVGGAGTGSLLLSDNASGLAVGSGSADSTAIVIGNGGNIAVSDNALIVSSRTLAVDGGSLTVADNAFASTDLLQVSTGSVTAGGLFLTQEGFVRLGGAGAVEFATDSISFESGVDTAGVVIDGADTLVSLNGGTATTPSTVLDRRLVIAGQQRMEITGGAEVDASGESPSGSQGDSIIGSQLGQSAILVVSGTDSTLRTGGTLLIGGDGADPQNGAQNGTATLEAFGGAKLFSDRVAVSGGVNNPAITDPNIRTQGLAQIADAGTVWNMNKLAVAGTTRSVGDLQIADGAVANVNGPVVIGRGSSALGLMSVIDGAAALNITAGTGPALEIGVDTATTAGLVGGGRLLVEGGTVRIDATASGDSRVIVGRLGQGTVNIGAGGAFLVDAAGSLQGGLGIGTNGGVGSFNLVGDAFGSAGATIRHSGNSARVGVGVSDGSVTDGFTTGNLLLSGPSNFLIEGVGQAAELAIGLGQGSSGALTIASDVNGGAALTLRGTTAQAVVAASPDSNGRIDIAGAGSSLSITGTDASLAIGTGDAAFQPAGTGTPAGVVRVSDGASLVVAGTASSTIAVGSGQNGGLLTVDNATASVAGDLDIARTATTGSTGNGRVQIGNGGVMSVTGTTRVFAGGSLGGFDTLSVTPALFDTLDQPTSVTAVVGIDGILRTPILELYAGGSIDIDNLEIEGLQEFRLFDGATVSSSLEAFIGDNISRVKAQGATIALGNVLGIGTTTANAGLFDLASGSSADIDGLVNIGGALGNGRVNVLSGSIVRVRSAATGAGNAAVGSGGILDVAGTGSRAELDGRLVVEGGEVNLTNGAGFAIGGLDLLNGTVSASATTGSIFGSIVVGGGTGTTARVDLIEESLVNANVSSVNIGTGAGSAQLDINGSTLRIAAQGEGSLDFAVGSSGTVRVGNGGELEVSGDIDLNGGLLTVNGTGRLVADNLNANAGARITGTGRIALDSTLRAGSGSTLAPGNSPGLLTINGDLTIDGGTLLIELAGADPGQYDVLRVEGDLAFNSGAFNLSLLDGFKPAGNSEFRVIEVRDTLSLNTGAVTFGYVGMGPDYTFSVRDYTETIGSVSDTYQGGFVTFVAQDIAPTPGLNPNEVALAESLDQLCPLVEGLSDPTQDEEDLDRICGGLRNGGNSEEQVQAALDALSPEEVANTLNTVLRFTTVQHGNLSQRINGLRYGVKPIDFSGVNLQFEEHYIAGRDIERVLEGLIGGAASADEDFARWGFFGNAAMNRGDKDATSNDNGFDFDGTVLSFGADYRLQDNLFLGGALGYNDLTADFQAGGGLDFQSISASLFGTWLYKESGYVDALVTFGSSETETERLVRYDDAIGSVDRIAKGDADGSQLLASIGGGWDFARGAFVLGPHVGFNYVESTVDEFDETGALGANLSIPEQETRSLTGNIGMHLSYTWTPSFGVVIPNVRLDWVREFEDDAETVNVRFLNDRFSQDPLDPSTPFAVQNDAPDGEYLSWSVGASAQFINGIAAFVNYRGNAMQKDISLGEFTVGVRMEKAF